MNANKKVSIAWLSPYDENSSIGEFSFSILEAIFENDCLRSECDITIYTNITETLYRSSWGIVDIDVLARSPIYGGEILKKTHDYVFFNFGNNVENHEKIIELANFCCGIVILHDNLYQHYFANIIFEKNKCPLMYAYAMAKYHGTEGANLVFNTSICHDNRTLRVAPWDSCDCSKLNLVHALLDNTNIVGVVVNSNYAFETINTKHKIIRKLRLPGDEKNLLDDHAIDSWRVSTRNKQIASVVSFGVIQRTKHIEVMISTIARSPQLQECLRYTIAGIAPDKEYLADLKRMIHDLNLSRVVSIEESVSVSRLASIKCEADIFVNIRHPNTEGCSGSLIEQMACGKPIVALRSGCYAEPPSGIVYVDSINSEDQLEKVVLDLICKPEMRIEVGRQARDYALQYRSIDYAEDILGFAREAYTNWVEPSIEGGTHLSKMLQVDRYVRSPGPIINFSDDLIVFFLATVFNLNNIKSDSLTWFVKLRNTQIDKAVEVYQLSRTIEAIHEDIIVDNRWRLPLLFPADLLTFYILNSIDEFDNVCKKLQFSSAQLNFVVCKAKRRIAFHDVDSKIALLVHCLEFIEPCGRLKDIRVTHFGSPKRLIELVKKIIEICEMSDAQYDEFASNLAYETLDCEEYLMEYADVAECRECEHVSYASIHFNKFGRNEGRTIRVLSSAL